MKYKQATTCTFLNHNFKLRFAEQRYHQIQCKLHEQFQSVQIQLKNMQQMLNKSSVLTQPIITKTRRQYKNIYQFSKQLRNDLTSLLLIKQTKLQDQAQRRDIIRQYQERICQMDNNRYTKQVDISVDHIGKRNTQKPFVGRVREFTRIKTQQHNIYNFIRKIEELQNNIITVVNLNKQKSKQINSQPSNKISEISQICDSKTLSMITKNSSNCQPSYDSSNLQYMEPNPQSGQSSIVSCSKKQKLLLLNSQQKLFKQIFKSTKNKIDPQLIKVLQLIDQQKQRQQKIREEYNQLNHDCWNLQKSRQKLVLQYKQIRNQAKREALDKIQNEKQMRQIKIGY